MTLASRGGKWRPELLLISSVLNTWLLELVLVLPTPLFTLVFWLLGMFPKPHLISPGQLDLSEGRKTMVSAHLAELVEAGKRNNFPCHVCGLVLDRIKLIESSLDGGAASSRVSYSADHMVDIESQVRAIMSQKGHGSVSELWYWTVRGFGALSVLVLVIFLFLHDY